MPRRVIAIPLYDHTPDDELADSLEAVRNLGFAFEPIVVEPARPPADDGERHDRELAGRLALERDAVDEFPELYVDDPRLGPGERVDLSTGEVVYSASWL